MGRPLGANNIKESNRQLAVRLYREGKTKEQILESLAVNGSRGSTATQYYYFAKKKIENENSRFFRTEQIVLGGNSGLK